MRVFRLKPTDDNASQATVDVTDLVANGTILVIEHRSRLERD